MVFDARVTSSERTGWRDQEISQRHRRWGLYCTAVDIDFLLVEYKLGTPVALVEYKQCQAIPPDLTHGSYRALAALANASLIPFYIAVYWPESWAFQIEPGNEYALEWFFDGELLTEREYVTRMYKMRRETIPRDVLMESNTELPVWDSSRPLR